MKVAVDEVETKLATALKTQERLEAENSDLQMRVARLDHELTEQAENLNRLYKSNGELARKVITAVKERDDEKAAREATINERDNERRAREAVMAELNTVIARLRAVEKALAKERERAGVRRPNDREQQAAISVDPCSVLRADLVSARAEMQASEKKSLRLRVSWPLCMST
ncbi:MAG TPA: hypothetical protein VNM40_02925 [Candidatus Paceibacterota bacterium]|nr:hypothetical protein [Candidatus Paceibacterota bacterium]